MSYLVKRRDLIKIYNFLVTQLTKADHRWLKQHRRYRREIQLQSPLSKEYLNIYDLSFGIQDLIDCKLRSIKINYKFAGGLPRKRLEQLARILKIEDIEQPKYQLLQAVLRRLNS